MNDAWSTRRCVMILLSLLSFFAIAKGDGSFYIASSGFSSLENAEFIFQIYGIHTEPIQPASGTITISFPSLESFDEKWKPMTCAFYSNGGYVGIPFDLTFLEEIESLANTAVGEFHFPMLLGGTMMTSFRIDCNVIAPSANIRDSALIEMTFDQDLAANGVMNVGLQKVLLAEYSTVTLYPLAKAPVITKKQASQNDSDSSPALRKTSNMGTIDATRQGYLHVNITNTSKRSRGLYVQFDENAVVVLRSPACTVYVSEEDPITVFAKLDYRLVVLDDVAFIASRDVIVECPGVVVTRPSALTVVSSTVSSVGDGENSTKAVFSFASLPSLACVTPIFVVCMLVLFGHAL